MLSRRSFLGGMSAAVVGAPLMGAAFGGFATAAPRHAVAKAAGGSLPLTIVNHTYRYTNQQIYAYIVGTDLKTGQQIFVTRDGAATPVSAADNGSEGFADLSIPMVQDGDTHLAIPANMSGRVYFSIVDKVKFKVVTDGNGNAALQHPAGWVSGDPSFSVLHDWIEFTHNDGGMFCNTTMVDMFSIPLAIKLVGSATQDTGRLVDGGRDRIFEHVSADPTYAKLVVKDKLRVIAPGHGIDSGIFPADYFDSYIDAVWSKYSSETLTVNTGAGSFTGRVVDGRFTFSDGIASFAKPTTLDLLYCNGALGAPNDGRTGPVAAILGAAFNRSTLLTSTTQPTTDRESFYRDRISNRFSEAMHLNTVDGNAYGFAFDDVASFASYVQDGAPTSITVSLTNF
ncbi:beta-1,3-glucanase family protein [Umezawaea sp. Da 62-37]|uniref:beta-1,3-glucanase family protein n=1 Tax=Umezawaea sp. Da 62-37 TaxID=3075927 RepID=UPI0028F722F5|nr:beta-1,3-glucanase family protein [Umezawaea sp. Da 62-37]WNV85827.1 beta-1,3-glucanase family protein [Umezawaea sp. Da 62-37]